MNAPLVVDDDAETAALVANALADVAGDEAAVLARLSAMADEVGIDATRAALVCLAVVMFGRWLTPHTPGATVPVRIPTPKEIHP